MPRASVEVRGLIDVGRTFRAHVDELCATGGALQRKAERIGHARSVADPIGRSGRSSRGTPGLVSKPLAKPAESPVFRRNL